MEQQVRKGPETMTDVRAWQQVRLVLSFCPELPVDTVVADREH